MESVELGKKLYEETGCVKCFIFSGGAFSTVDVVGARGTQLTRIKNDGSITGAYSDAVNGQHGLTGR